MISVKTRTKPEVKVWLDYTFHVMLLRNIYY